MQQVAYEHAALIRTRPSNTIRARDICEVASRARTHVGTRRRAWVNLENTSCVRGGYICCSKRLTARVPLFPNGFLPKDPCDRYSERGIAVQDGDADLDPSDFPVEAHCDEALPQQYHAMHPLPGVHVYMRERGRRRPEACGYRAALLPGRRCKHRRVCIFEVLPSPALPPVECCFCTSPRVTPKACFQRDALIIRGRSAP